MTTGRRRGLHDPLIRQSVAAGLCLGLGLFGLLLMLGGAPWH